MRIGNAGVAPGFLLNSVVGWDGESRRECEIVGCVGVMGFLLITFMTKVNNTLLGELI